VYCESRECKAATACVPVSEERSAAAGNAVHPVRGAERFSAHSAAEFLLQYFINCNLQKGWFITWQPTLTANWEVPSGSQWVVPFRGGVGRIMKLGYQPVSLTEQFYGNAVHPIGTPAWTMRLQISVSQADRRTEKDVAGEKAERDGGAAAGEEVVAWPVAGGVD
jgi:hypothetical protein